MKASAVVFTGPGELEMRDVELREPQSDEVVVATAYSSISAGTERLLFNGRLPGMPHLRYPFVPGYEAAGVVTHVGADVNDVRVGDAVFVGGSMCYTDVAAVFGGQSSHLIKNAAQVIPLRSIPVAHAPMLALAATALHGIRRLGDVREKRVAVLGLGAVGQLAASFLSEAGAHVVLVDRSEQRLAQATGVERYDVSNVPLEELLTQPVHAVVEATGDSNQIALCARISQAGGTILLLSYYDNLTTPFVDLFVKESTLLVCREWAHADLVDARDAIASGAVQLSALVDHVVPIERYAQAYRTAFEDPTTLKVMLQWA